MSAYKFSSPTCSSVCLATNSGFVHSFDTSTLVKVALELRCYSSEETVNFLALVVASELDEIKQDRAVQSSEVLAVSHLIQILRLDEQQVA